MLRPKNLQLAAQYEALYNFLATAPYGMLFTHSALLEFFAQDPPPTKRYYALITKLSKELERKARRHLQSEPGIGYRLTEPDDFGEEADRFQRKGRRQLVRGLMIVKATPIDLTSLHTRLRNEARKTLLTQHVNLLRRRKTARQEESSSMDARVTTDLAAAHARIQALGQSR